MNNLSCPTYGPSGASRYVLAQRREAARRRLKLGDRLDW